MRRKFKSDHNTESAMTVCRHIGKRIKERRKQLNISQACIADLMKISYQQVQKYENGQSQIFIGRLLQFAQILNVAPEYFYHGLEAVTIGTRIENELIQRERLDPLEIMVVSANPSDAAAFERALHGLRDRAHVHMIDSPAAFARHIRTRNSLPSLIVIDIPPAQADGGNNSSALNLLRQLRGNSQTASIPVTLLTSGGSRKMMAEAYKLGIAGLVLKPASAEAYRENIRSFLQYWVNTVVMP